MDIGRSAPRHERMALLYPRSQELQAHFSEYFIEVVLLCRKVLGIAKKSFLNQFVSALNVSDLDTSALNLDAWAETINKEVISLIARSVETEAIESARFRDASQKASKLTVHREILKRNLSLLNSCSRYDHEATWRQTRRVGNARIPGYEADYHEWKNRNDSDTLVCTGKLGSGKSVLLANIVDDLNLHFQGLGEDAVVAYFFCRRDIVESLEERTIVGSFVRQVLRPIADLSHVADVLDETCTSLSSYQISNLLYRAIPRSRRIFLILDGLDECEDGERQRLMQMLRSIQQKLKLVVCMSFRPGVDDLAKFNSLPFWGHHIISIPEDNPDIEDFIDEKLRDYIQSGRLRLGDPRLVVDIHIALSRRAQGMFLWVALQIELLCLEKTDEAIRAALECLPRDLSETFARVLEKSEDSKRCMQKRILEVLMVSQRLLTTEELREALSVVPGNTMRNPARQINDINSTLGYCGSLIIVDEQDFTVRLIHHSVKQFLLEGYRDADGVALKTFAANKTMADIIVTYLNYGTFDTKLSTRVIPHILGEQVPPAVVRSTLRSSTKTQELALKALKSLKDHHDVRKILAEFTQSTESQALNDSLFLSYAKSHLFDHCWCYVWYLKSEMYNLLLKIVDVDSLTAIVDNEFPRTMASWDSQEGNSLLIKLFIVEKAHLGLLDIHGDTPFSWARKNRYVNIVGCLFDKDPALVDTHDGRLWVLLGWALKQGYTEIANIVIEKNAWLLNARDVDGCTLLWHFVVSDDQRAVSWLLSRGADVKETHRSSSLLQWAFENSRIMSLKQLLGAPGMSLDFRNKGFERGLVFWALEHKLTHQEHQETADSVLHCMMGRSMPAEEGGAWRRGLLLGAAEAGHDKITKLMLRKGANPNAYDDELELLLSTAARLGCVEIVKLLLRKGANPTLRGEDERRKTREIALQKGYHEIVSLLIEAEATWEIEEETRRKIEADTTADQTSDRCHDTSDQESK